MISAPWSLANAVEPLTQLNIILLQPGKLIEERISGADALAAYVNRLGAAATETMRANPRQIPSAGFIVIAVRPQGKTHVWFDFKPALAPLTMDALTQTVETVEPLPVRQGNLIFALRVTLWGAKPPTAYAPAPAEWREAAKQARRQLEIDELIDQIWPR